jgi:hypothetical protein
MTFSYTDYKATIEVETKGKKNLFCTEVILLSNTELHHSEEFFLPKKHKLTLTVPGEVGNEDMLVNGLDFIPT